MGLFVCLFVFVTCKVTVSRLETQVKIMRTFVDAEEAGKAGKAGFRDINEATQGLEMWAECEVLTEPPTKYWEITKVKPTSIVLQLLMPGGCEISALLSELVKKFFCSGLYLLWSEQINRKFNLESILSY